MKAEKFFISPWLVGDKLEELVDRLNREAGNEKWQDYAGLYARRIGDVISGGIREGRIHIRRPPVYSAVKIILPYTFDNEKDMVEWGEVRAYLTEETTCGFPEIPPWAPEAEEAATDSEPKTGGNENELSATKRTGRPPSVKKKAEIVRQIVVAFEQVAETQFNPAAPPGSAADLLEACQRIEKSLTGKISEMMATADAFKNWLREAGYSFPKHRPLKEEATFWTHLAPKTTGKIAAELFTGVIPEKPL